MPHAEKVAVVLAAYNEGPNLALLLPRLRAVLDALGLPWEMVLVLDGDDGAHEWVARFAQGLLPGQVKVSWSPQRRGFGNALREGFRLVSPDAVYVATLDCDLNHSPEELPRFVEALRQGGVQVVVGSRYLNGGMVSVLPWWKRWASSLTNRALALLTGTPLTDITSNYRLYRREVVQGLAQACGANDFSFAPQVILHLARRGVRIAEVPIAFHPRRHGVSKLPKASTTLGYLRLFTVHLFLRLVPWGKGKARDGGG
ncbi:Polyprenol monophosphomannose synthase [bacterium HR23]|nr:Polyprenol monophosphomannose synthase [bacterium HR23]